MSEDTLVDTLGDILRPGVHKAFDAGYQKGFKDGQQAERERKCMWVLDMASPRFEQTQCGNFVVRQNGKMCQWCGGIIQEML